MKSLLTGAALLATLLSGPPSKTNDSIELEIMLQAEELFNTKVKIFDTKGNLLKELQTQDVANEDITVADYFLLDSSDFLFDHQGDYYYMRD